MSRKNLRDVGMEDDDNATKQLSPSDEQLKTELGLCLDQNCRRSTGVEISLVPLWKAGLSDTISANKALP